MSAMRLMQMAACIAVILMMANVWLTVVLWHR